MLHLFDAFNGVSLLLAMAMCVELIKATQRKREANKRRNREFALHAIEHMPDEEFKRMFRMSRFTFETLIAKLMDRWDEVDVTQAARSSGSHICLRTRLACTLRWMAGGSYLDICFEFGISRGAFFCNNGVLWGTMEMLNETFDLGFPFSDDNKLREMATQFAKFSHNKMTNCVLAIDGWVCRTRCPTAKEVKYPMSYRNRHGCFGIVVLAGCDAMLRFHMFSCVSAGSTNDIMAWTFCSMKHLLDNGHLPEPYYFVGDEAFICSQQFLVPWSGRGLPADKDSFNYHLSSMRQCIERAFALLTNRWGIFWRPLRCAYDRWTLVCMVAAKLHNFCIDMEDAQPTRRHAGDHLDMDAPLVFLNRVSREEEEDENPLNRRPSGYTRQQITAALERD